MARARRTSSLLETARQRLNGLNAITPAPNLGANLTPTSFAAGVTAFTAQLNTHNEHVAALDDEQNQLESAEIALRDLNRRILSAIEAQRSTAPTAASMNRSAGRGRANGSGPRAKRRVDRVRRHQAPNTNPGAYSARQTPECEGGARRTSIAR